MPHMRRVLLPLILTLLMCACETIPTTHMLVPSQTTVSAMQHVAKQTGAIAIVITTQGEEKTLRVGAGRPDTLSGNVIDGGDLFGGQAASSPATVGLPLDSIALIYYTKPRSERVAWRDKLPRKDDFPELTTVSKAEQTLPCEMLDTALSRAEALRWIARRNGAMPFTGTEKLTLHAKHFAIDAGITAVVLLALASGASPAGCLPSCGPPPNDGAWHVKLEGYRWSISAIDARVEGLLRLKKQRQCRARATLQADSTDLKILEDLDAWKAQQPGTHLDEHALLTRRTIVFDQLGPKELTQPEGSQLQATTADPTRQVRRRRRT